MPYFKIMQSTGEKTTEWGRAYGPTADEALAAARLDDSSIRMMSRACDVILKERLTPAETPHLWVDDEAAK